MMKATLSRRGFLAGGSLVVSFSMLGGRGLAQSAPTPPEGPPFGDMKMYPYLDSWIGIDETGAVTVYSGKAELGQGVETAFLQCAAEQLAVEPGAITMLMASTTRMLNEGYTAGSDSMMSAQHLPHLRHANRAVRDRPGSMPRACSWRCLDCSVGLCSAPDSWHRLCRL